MSTLKAVIEGSSSNYDSEKLKDCIYFCIDTNTIIYNNVEYAASDTVPDINIMLQKSRGTDLPENTLLVGFSNGRNVDIPIMTKPEFDLLNKLEKRVTDLENK